ncbi:hypothetical protein Syun_030101 [Stephania yunnanensis]|uniref:Uncharacterized protein n=1 Tax=Stephania yunnanensis TaxID=152371 RepID=A0AAP0EBE8_9MAGN
MSSDGGASGGQRRGRAAGARRRLRGWISRRRGEDVAKKQQRGGFGGAGEGPAADSDGAGEAAAPVAWWRGFDRSDSQFRRNRDYAMEGLGVGCRMRKSRHERRFEVREFRGSQRSI